MVKGLYTAHTGMVNEMKRLDILANNLANADTTASVSYTHLTLPTNSRV